MLGVIAAAAASRFSRVNNRSWLDYESAMRAEKSSPSEEAVSSSPLVTERALAGVAVDDKMSDCGSDTTSVMSISELPESDISHELTCPGGGCDRSFTSPQLFTQHFRSVHLHDSSSCVCIICAKQLSSPTSLDRHLLGHAGYRAFGCRRCGLRFLTNGSLHRHSRGGHCSGETARRPAKRRGGSDGGDRASENGGCPEGKRRAPSMPALTPLSALETDIQPRLKCSTCGEMVADLSALIEHKYRVHSGEDAKSEQLSCDKCSFRTSDPEDMQQHEARHKCSDWIQHIRYPLPGGGGAPADQRRPDPSRSDLADISSILSLASPGSSLAGSRLTAGRPNSPHRADRASTSPPPEYPLKETARDAPSTQHQEDVEDPAFEHIRTMKAKGEFPCRLCDQVFPNLRAMKGHNRVHMSSTPYECNVCPFSSGDKSTLTRHMKDHNGERPYECRICKFAFTTKANCERHLKNRHQLKLREMLTDNMIVHLSAESASPQKPPAPPAQCTVCSVCNTDFKLPKVLKEHMRSQHGPGGRRGLVICSVCDHNFPEHSLAVQHVRKHHPTKEPGLVLQERPPRPEESTNDLSSVESLIDQSKRRPMPFPIPPTLISIPAMMKRPPPPIVPLRQPSPPHQPAPPQVPVVSKAPPTPPMHQQPERSPSPEVVIDEPMPLDLSKKSTEPPKRAEPEVSKPEQTPEKLPAGILPPPLNALYMPYPANMPGMPLFVMPGMFHYALDEHWQSRLGREMARGLQLGSGGGILDPQHHMHAFTSALSMAAQAHMGRGGDEQKEDSEPRWSPKLSSDHISGHQPQRDGSAQSPDSLLKNKPKQRRYRTQRPFSCNYCEARFTLSTNMDRHVKNHHPDKWERKSRGVRRPGPLPGADGSVPANASPKPAGAPSGGGSPGRDPASPSHGYASDEESQLIIDEPSAAPAARRDEDLASVSRLVDVAQAQTFQQYFRSDEERSDGVGGDDNGSCGSGDDDSEERALEKRRSAYSNAPNKIPCRVCKREFPWSSSLKRHELTHSGEKPFKCPHCPVNFTTKSNCDRHLVRKHSNGASDDSSSLRNVPDRPFKCALCPSSTFSTHENLAQHHALKHAPGAEGPPTQHQYWCHVCEERFFDLERVKDHVEAEHELVWAELERCNSRWVSEIAEEDQGLDKIFCMVCLSGFSTTEELRDHMTTEHLSETPADLSCDLCGERYSLEHALAQHRRRHDGAPPQEAASPGIAPAPEPARPDAAKKRKNLNDLSARLSAASALRLTNQSAGERSE